MNDKNHGDDAEAPKIVKHINWLFRNWRDHPIPIILAGAIALAPVVWQFRSHIQDLIDPANPSFALSISNFRIGATDINEFLEGRNLSSSRVSSVRLSPDIFGEDNKFQQIDGKAPIEGFSRSVDYSARFQDEVLRSIELRYDCNLRQDGQCWRHCSEFVDFAKQWYFSNIGTSLDIFRDKKLPLKRHKDTETVAGDRIQMRNYQTQISHISENRFGDFLINVDRWYWGEYTERWTRPTEHSRWELSWRRPEEDNSYYYCTSLLEIHKLIGAK